MATQPVPAFFIIGDDLSFRLDDVRSGRDGHPLINAVITYELLHERTRTSVHSGSMAIYDNVNASFDGVIPKSFLQQYNSTTNPTGIKVKNEYVLRALIVDSGIRTTKAMELIALLDPPNVF